MNTEQTEQQDMSGPGRLYFLSKAGTERFSGFGLAAEADRCDRLIGLLMVDGHRPESRVWLDRIEAQYGDYQLLSMTAAGERGILAQMRIEPESLSFLERFDHPIAQDLKRVLAPFLDKPPSPTFKLRWDPGQRNWRSDFWIGLPPELQDEFEESGYDCMAVERADSTVAFATHLPSESIESLRRAPLVYDWQFLPRAGTHRIRFYAALLDDPYRPYHLEHWLDVSDPVHARYLAHLMQQPSLIFDVYGDEYEYAYSREIAHPVASRDHLSWLLHMAEERNRSVLCEHDCNHVKAFFQSNVSL